MTTECFISVRDVQYTLFYDGYHIVVVTDIPCHLWMRWSLEPPQKHIVPRYLRGTYIHGDTYLCFVGYHDNEQEEAGDTLIHTFVKRPWPICQTRYFHFWGTVAGAPCRSTSGVFQLHFTPPPLFTGMPQWHNRFVQSTHGTWSLARNGINESKYGLYQRPQNLLLVRTWLIATYFIIRAYLNFHTLDVPAGRTITHARLGIYPTSLTGLVYGIVLTKGLWSEPVTLDDFGLQTNETTVLGEINQGDIVLNEYNWIELNDEGIAYINQMVGEKNQHESFDWWKSAYFNIFASQWHSQSFTPQNNHTLTSVKLRIKKKGSPGTFYVAIKKASATHTPTGPALASGTVHPAYISTDYWGDWCEITLGAGFGASAGTEYCIECHIAGGDATNCVQWIGNTASQYPNGLQSWSADAGASWAPSVSNDVHFIEYSSEIVGGTKFCIRTSYDNSNVPPIIGADQEIQFYSAQAGDGYQPLLELILD